MKTWLVSAFAAAVTLALAPAMAQVTYVNKPPTPEQFREMLRSKPAGAVAMSREIVLHPDASAGGGAAPAAANAPAAAPGRADAGGGVAVAMPINFDVGSARVSQTSMGYVDAIAQLLAQDANLRLTIEGHTDASGNAQRNLVLSWDRALAVYKVLVERYGIDGQRLQPIGRGSFEPLQGLVESSPLNRRVQIRIAG